MKIIRILSIIFCCVILLGIHPGIVAAQSPQQKGNQQQTHMECVGMECKGVPGPGTNACSINFDCQRNKCVNYACVAIQKDGQPSSCSFDAGCDTECTKDGAGTGSIYTEGQCGACTTGACQGKAVGDSCQVDQHMYSGEAGDGIGFTISTKGKCKGSDNCSAADPGGVDYKNACGLACACDLNPNNVEIIIDSIDLSYQQ